MWELHQLFYVKDSEETVDKLTDEFKKISISHEINRIAKDKYSFDMKGILGLWKIIPKFKMLIEFMPAEGKKRIDVTIKPNYVFYIFDIVTTFCFAYMFVKSVLEKMLPALFFVVLLCAMKLLNFFELRTQQTRCMKRIEGILLKERKNLEDI